MGPEHVMGISSASNKVPQYNHNTAPMHGSLQSMAQQPNSSNRPMISRVQEIIGMRATSLCPCNTILLALDTLTSAPKSEDTVTALVQLLNYGTTHSSDAAIHFFHASDMLVLYAHSNASYLSEAYAHNSSCG